MHNLRLKTLILGKFEGKIEILSTIIFSVGNLQLSDGKLQFPVPRTFYPTTPLPMGGN